MTGRDLIIYILENELENESIFNDASGIFITDATYAALNVVGVETIRALHKCGDLNGAEIDGNLYFLNPMKRKL